MKLIGLLKGILFELKTGSASMQYVDSASGYADVRRLVNGLESICNKEPNCQHRIVPETIEPPVPIIIGKYKGAASKVVSTVRKSTYNIVFHPQNNLSGKGENALYSFKDLAKLGEIKAVKSLPSEDDRDRWSLFFVGECCLDEMKETLTSIGECCSIRKIADFDLFEEDKLQDSVGQKNQQIAETVDPDIDFFASAMGQFVVKQINVDGKDRVRIESACQNKGYISADYEKIDFLMYLAEELVKCNLQIVLQAREDSLGPAHMQTEKFDVFHGHFHGDELDIRVQASVYNFS
ncbi:MAG: hypothetical protein QM786_19610 [Breznakibacter sp.]